MHVEHYRCTVTVHSIFIWLAVNNVSFPSFSIIKNHTVVLCIFVSHHLESGRPRPRTKKSVKQMYFIFGPAAMVCLK